MAYPEPIPAITGRKAREFLERLKAFRMTSKQKGFFKGSREFYRHRKPKE